MNGFYRDDTGHVLFCSAEDAECQGLKPLSTPNAGQVAQALRPLVDLQFRADGYRHEAPTDEVAIMDAEIAERYPCPRCGGAMRYDAWSRPGSYVALAVCTQCGHQWAF